MSQIKAMIAKQKSTNSGGKKSPFTPEKINVIAYALKQEKRYRDLALFRLAISIMARASDIVEIRMEDIVDFQGNVSNRIRFMQQKTSKAVEVPFSAPARQALEKLIQEEGKVYSD